MPRLAAILTLILSLCIGLVIFLARQQPLPPRLAMLHLTDCAPPCWIGITPGVTPADQVKARIQAVYGDTSAYIIAVNESNGLVISRVDDPQYATAITVQWLSTAQHTVEWLDVSSSADLNVTDIFVVLGIPLGTATHLSTGGGVPALLYKNTVVDVWNSPNEQLLTGKVGLHDKVAAIAFSIDDYYRFPFVRWRGFNMP
ncbi:MAG TPA: hypothetical protein VKQ72_10680 [Aggregatilineales bacterium]|nr:hypothetical protein [Aggregatilineales bacterium]